jgi:LacI family transcriptional regulator
MTRASQISKIILERTGYIISIQAVCDLLNGRPNMLKVKTLQAICDAFYCKLSDFCEVMPLAASKAHVTGIQD